MSVDRPSVGLIDTNIVLLLERIRDLTHLPSTPLISVITLAELTVGPLVARTDAERAVRQAHLQQAEADFDPVPFDAAAARTFGRVAAALRGAGRKPMARAFDAMIAATAMSRGLPLYTTDADGYRGIDGLEVVVVPHPDGPTAVP